MMKIKFFIIVSYLVFAMLAMRFTKHSSSLDSHNIWETNIETAVQTLPSKKEFPAFRDEYAPPDWWKRENQKDSAKYPIFELRQDYPTDLKFEPLEWKKKEFEVIFDVSKPYEERKKLAKRYIIEVLKYAYKGNVENNWVVKNNVSRKWFHAPWLHVNYRLKDDKFINRNSGTREFMHGLTSERCSCQDELNSPEIGDSCPPVPADFQDSEEKLCPDLSPVQNWGIAFFNENGAVTVGKVWQEMTIHERDVRKYPNLKNIDKTDFPDGTVIIKLLFTSATDAEAPNLAGSGLKWNADTNRYKHRVTKGETDFSEENCRSEENLNKCFPVLRLLQIDVAVREGRANKTTGWVFGTFIYNTSAKSVFDENREPASDWEKVEPIGMMFGNDPKVDLSQPSSNLRENFIFTKLKQHLGCGGRLNGPVDNPAQSCLACHASAEISQKYIKTATNKNPCNAESFTSHFRNVKSGTPITSEGISLHYSLQLQAGIVRYCIANPQNCVGKGKNEKFAFSQEVTRDQ